MKSISSAIVILAGIYGMTAALPMFVMTKSIFPFIGLAVSISTVALGLVGWWASLKYDR